MSSRKRFDAAQAAADLAHSQAGRASVDFSPHLSDNNTNPAPSFQSAGGGTFRRSQTGSQGTSRSPEPTACLFSDTPSDIARVWIDCTIAADVELCRIAIGLRQSAQCRLWLIGLQYTRDTGFNYLDRNQFAALLERYGIKYTRANLNRWLRAGQGVYWRLTTYGRIYLASYENLAVELVQKAHEFKLYDLVSTNTPGQRRAMYVNVQSSNLQQFEAQCYAAWHASKNNPTLSRFVLMRLWNKNGRSLRRLEKLAGITVIANTVETDDPSKVPFTSQGNLRGDVKTISQSNGKTFYQFNMPNTYQTGMIRQHNRRGASRRVSIVIRSLLQSETLTGFSGQGANAPGELCHTGRIYCETSKTAKTSRRRGNTNTLYVPDQPGQGASVVWCIYH